MRGLGQAWIGVILGCAGGRATPDTAIAEAGRAVEVAALKPGPSSAAAKPGPAGQVAGEQPTPAVEAPTLAPQEVTAQPAPAAQPEPGAAAEPAAGVAPEGAPVAAQPVPGLAATPPDAGAAGAPPGAPAADAPVAGAAPAAEPAPPAAPSGARVGPRTAVEVVVGSGAACARMDDGTVRCWGRGHMGELGRVRTAATSPVAVPGVAGAIGLAIGFDPGGYGDGVCARSSDGAVTCWGYANALPLSPEAASAGRWTAPSYGDAIADWERPAAAPAPIPALQGATSIAFGEGTGYAALGDGSVIGWGSGAYNAFANDRSRDQPDPVVIAGVAGAVEVSAGSDHACARVAQGAVSCWGYQAVHRGVTAVQGVDGATALASSRDWTCAATQTGLLCWGPDLGVTRPLSVPVTAISGGHRFCAVAGGRAQCWAPAGTPAAVDVAGGAVSVSVGASSACAVAGSGAVQCWGGNRFGQLGDTSLADRAAPALVRHLELEALPEPEAPPAPTGTAPSDVPPEGCKRDASLATSHPRFPGDQFPVLGALAYSQIRGTAVTVVLSNATLPTPAEFWRLEPPRGAEVRIHVRFARLGQAERVPVAIEPGTFPTNHGQRQLAFASVVDSTTRPGGELLGDTRGKGKVELTVLTDEWVCGTLSLKSKDTSVSGAFAARRVPAPRATAPETTP